MIEVAPLLPPSPPLVLAERSGRSGGGDFSLASDPVSHLSGLDSCPPPVCFCAPGPWLGTDVLPWGRPAVLLPVPARRAC